MGEEEMVKRLVEKMNDKIKMEMDRKNSIAAVSNKLRWHEFSLQGEANYGNPKKLIISYYRSEFQLCS